MVMSDLRKNAQFQRKSLKTMILAQFGPDSITKQLFSICFVRVDFSKLDQKIQDRFFHFFEFRPTFGNIRQKWLKLECFNLIQHILTHIFRFRWKFEKMRKPILEKNKLYMIEVRFFILLAYFFSYLVRARAKLHQNGIARNQCFGKKVVIFNIKTQRPP